MPKIRVGFPTVPLEMSQNAGLVFPDHPVGAPPASSPDSSAAGTLPGTRAVGLTRDVTAPSAW